MTRPIEGYAFNYEVDEYDPSKPSIIRGYFPRDENNDYYNRLSVDTRIQIEELIMQAIANWPTYNTDQLVSDIANVDFFDVNEAQFRMILNQTFIENSEYPTILKLNTEG